MCYLPIMKLTCKAAEWGLLPLARLDRHRDELYVAMKAEGVGHVDSSLNPAQLCFDGASSIGPFTPAGRGCMHQPLSITAQWRLFKPEMQADSYSAQESSPENGKVSEPVITQTHANAGNIETPGNQGVCYEVYGCRYLPMDIDIDIYTP